MRELDRFMSIPQREPALVKEFRDLYDYVFELGRHVTLVYKRLENIEIRLKEISVKFNESTTENRDEIENMREKMFTRSEFDDFVGGLRAKVDEALPSLPESQPTTYESTEATSQQIEESQSQSEPSQEEQQGGIFSWRRSDTSKDSY